MSGLPATIDPVLLADRGVRLTGSMPVSALARLAASCRKPQGKVEVDLAFERSGSGDLRRITGRLHAQVTVECQRCLQPMQIEVEAEPELIVLRPGEREDLVESEADTMVADRPVPLSQIVEDELLLVMPMYPMHPPGGCPDGAGADQTDKGKPFEALKELRTRKD